MGLISKTVRIKWNGKTKKHYEELGYKWTKANEEFEVKVEDLTEGSHVVVECVCDGCGEKINRVYKDYIRSIKKDDKIYCNICSNKIVSGEKTRKTKLKKGKSFAKWLIDNYGENALKLYWDYDKNIINPYEISYSSNKKVWIYCQERNYHNSYEAMCSAFINGVRCPYCNKNSGKVHALDSLGQYIIDNYGEDFLWKIWSDKNKVSPFKVTPSSNKKVWWKCLDGKHEDFYRSCNSSKRLNYRCPKML